MEKTMCVAKALYDMYYEQKDNPLRFRVREVCPIFRKD